MINYIFSSFFILGIMYSFFNNIDISNEILLATTKSIELIFSIIPIMCLWLGIMNIAKTSGLLDTMAKLLTPILKYIFPEIPKEHKSFSYISINIIMNALGLGNAATPFGLKAMKELQQINSEKDIASRSMITFLILNTAAVTIIPTTIISLRILNKSINPLEIVPYIVITSSISCIIGLIIDRLYYMVIRK